MAPKLKPETLEERRAQILQAALTCFSRKGYHQTTMDDIVEEAGLSKGGVYWHFGSKKELFLALFEPFLDATEQIMLTALDTGKSARDKLEATLELSSTLSTSDEFQEIMPLMIDVWAQNWRDPEVNDVATGMYHRLLGPFVQLIEEGIASGEFKPVDARAMAGIIFGLYDGLAVQAMIDETLVDWDAVKDALRQTLIAGLLKQERA
jgi:AcrR family transcriptional regulator